ncbi:hypothetical protein VN21_01410 [Paraclostridium benzoelyticum]|uniref:Uncharacterized protein n=2 Tax=Paraclostridium TaxID=1849822 RepID=A0A0M3DMW9_9FIRM|nr:hypothetical protein [Paraclostridium benzoelyticum]KKY02762.1 hypothetical protein VN21_01410 [Paraclostridium benzoelyticum]MDM8128565.1 hypothetical protein [Paraclostridium benzoelyticum]
MIIDAIEVKVKKNDVKKFERDNIPLMSKVIQLNPRIRNTTLKYIEHKVITYDIVIKIKGKSIFKQEINRSKIIMLVNTHTGFSKSITKAPDTYKVNISKNNIKKSEMDEVHMLENIKNEMIKVIKNNVINSKCHIHDIKVLDIKSIYKPYWVGTYNGKSVLLEA